MARCHVVAFAAAGLLACEPAAVAQTGSGIRVAEMTEIAPYRLTGVEGFVEGGQWQDRDGIAAASGNNSSTTLTHSVAKAFVLTHGYVYHPNLLLLDLGAGATLQRDRYADMLRSVATTRASEDLSARATFLRDMPYRASLNFERLSESRAVGPSQSILTRNTRYGFDAALLAPVSSVPVRLGASRFKSQGSGADQVVDDDITQVEFSAERAWSRDSYSNFRWQTVSSDFNSGTTALPIQGTVSHTRRAELENVVSLGENELSTLRQALSYQSIDFRSGGAALANDQLVRMDINYGAKPGDSLDLRLRYHFDESRRPIGTATGAAESNRLETAGAGMTWKVTPELGIAMDAAASVNRATALNARMANLSGAVTLHQPLETGEVTANYTAVRSWQDQVAKEAQVAVVGESVVLTALGWTALQRPLVIAGSVVVRNAARTQTFVEGVDFTLRTIGLNTEIRRLASGAILDGQQLLVDYERDTGGTYAMTGWDQTLSATWNLRREFGVYGRYAERSPNLRSGASTSPMDTGRELQLGAQADVPFEWLSEQMTAGARAERTRRDEALLPLTRTSQETYLESTVPGLARGGLRLGLRTQHIAYLRESSQDVSQRTVTLSFWTRLRNGLSLSADALFNRDDGAPLLTRSYRQTSVKAQWRVRKLQATLRVDTTEQAQPSARQKATRARLDVRRDF